jgi:hypothetical protein
MPFRDDDFIHHAFPRRLVGFHFGKVSYNKFECISNSNSFTKGLKFPQIHGRGSAFFSGTNIEIWKYNIRQAISLDEFAFAPCLCVASLLMMDG